MKAFVILRKDSTAENDIRPSMVEVTDPVKIDEILTNLAASLPNNSDYQFFDEHEVFGKKDSFFKDYVDAIFEVYFPSTYDSVKKVRTYTPKSGVISSPPLTFYIHRWGSMSVLPEIKKIYFFSDDNDKEENQRVLILSMD